MTSLVDRLLGDRAGAAAVEAAFALPLALLLLLGVMEAGRMAWVRSTLNFAVQEAARCASVRPSVCSSSAQTAAFAASKATGLSLPASAFTVTPLPCGTQVRGEANYSFLIQKLAPSVPKMSAQVCRA